MRIFPYITLTVLLGTISSLAIADTRSLGKDYRTLLSNYLIVGQIKHRCSTISFPPMEPRDNVEKILQEKLGMDNYNKVLFQIHQSNLKANALKTLDTLWGKIESCEDKKLGEALERISSVHAKTFARYEKEPSLIKTKAVPIPLRK